MGRFHIAILAPLLIALLTAGCEEVSTGTGASSSSATKVDGEVPGCDSNGSAYVYNPNCATPTPSPTPAPGNESYVQFVTNGDSRCGISAGGQLQCWGMLLSSPMDGTGNNGFATYDHPEVIDFGQAYQDIVIGNRGGYPHWCGITDAGVLKCWGSNLFGQVGDGTTTSRVLPSEIDSGTLYKKISIGGDGSSGHSCGITLNGVLKCWGSGQYVGVGDGTTAQRLTPTVIDPGVLYNSISVGNESFCGITDGGILKCWGENFRHFQIGDGTSVNRNSPVVIDSGTSYKFIKTSYTMTCGITLAGVSKCWGTGYINGTWQYQNRPTVIGTDFQEIALGDAHICGLTTSSAVKCWGMNFFGSVGNGTTSPQNTPETIDSGGPYSRIFAGGSQSCGMTSVGILRCWGNNQLIPAELTSP